MGHTFIIAEAGINHNGIFSEACRLASVAKDSGADAVKFQTWFRNDWPQYDYLRFTKDEWQKLFNYCEIIGIKWFSTPFDYEAMDFLKAHGMDIWKVPSGMVTHEDYLAEIERHSQGQWVIVSTGMCNHDESSSCLTIKGADPGKLSILHCVTGYPAKYEEVNLNVLDWGLFDGLSDHTPGIEIPIAAVALGAKVIEKHLTLDRKQDGPDHQASLEPHEFKEMVRCIRNVEKAMGDGVKKPTPSELQVRDEIRQRMKIPAKEG